VKQLPQQAPGTAAASAAPRERLAFAQLMVLAGECWAADGAARPSFASIVPRLQAVLAEVLGDAAPNDAAAAAAAAAAANDDQIEVTVHGVREHV
jgi:hypothetical protein